MHPYRTRFKNEIVTEFFPPLTKRKPKGNKVIIFCSGMPGMPGKGSVLEFYAKKGFWVFAPRYRGTWESGGKFLRNSPEKDILDIIDELPKGFTEAFAHKKFKVKLDKLYLFGSSFGGPAALLGLRDKRVTKVVAFSPVVDWEDHIKNGETIDWMYDFTREAFGEAYRFSKKDWDKQKSGNFYNPMAHTKEIDGSRVLILHAKDDDIVRWQPVEKFAHLTNSKLLLLKTGGHCSSAWFIKPRFYKKIADFLKSKPASRNH